jgi:hypothetical protein
MGNEIERFSYGNMLKSKQSRLTKKMKNAKLSSKTFERSFGFVADVTEAREFSELEECFFHSVQCHQERAEIKFHMQKRSGVSSFSNLCVSIGQTIGCRTTGSVVSVEEMDRRASHAEEAARVARRKLMMGFALRHDAKEAPISASLSNTPTDALQAAEESAAASVCTSVLKGLM